MNETSVLIAWLPFPSYIIYSFRVVYFPWYDPAAAIAAPWQNTPNVTLTNLVPGLQYNYSVGVYASKTVNMNGSCIEQLLNQSMFSTPQLAPSAPVIDLTTAVETDGVMVNWTAPDVLHQGGRVLGFNVTCVRVPGQQRSNPNLDHIQWQSYIITVELSTTNGGQPDAGVFIALQEVAIEYNISVYAINAAGQGPSAWVIGQTLEQGEVHLLFYL